MLFCTGLLFLATQLPGAHWNPEGQSRSDGVQNIRAVMGRGRARLGTSCQIIPFCWTQTRSVTSRFGVTALRPLHAGWAVGRALPLNFIWSRYSCGVSLPPSPWGPVMRQMDFWEKGLAPPRTREPFRGAQGWKAEPSYGCSPQLLGGIWGVSAYPGSPQPLAATISLERASTRGYR